MKAPKEEWEAKTKKIEGVIEERKRVLDEIDKSCSANRFDRTKLREHESSNQRFS